MQVPLSRENMVRGVLLFVLFTLIGLLVSFLLSSGTQDLKSGFEGLKKVFWEMRYEYLIGASLFMLVDWFFSGLRFHIFIRVVTPTIKFKDSFRAILATVCVSAITPFQTGGVGHLYIYARAGVPLSGAITAGISSFLATLVILIISAGGILVINPSFIPKGTSWISFFSFLIFGLVFTTFLLLLFKPDIVSRFFYWVSGHVGRRFKPIAPFLERAKSKVEQITTEHKTFARHLVRHYKWVYILSLLCTCGFFAGRIISGYYVLRAFNTHATLWELCVVEMLYNFVVLFMPTPGASGIAEGTKSLLMKSLIASKFVTPFVLLNRFFSVYCGVIVGGIIITLQLAKDIRNNKDELENTSLTHHEPIK